MSIWEKSLLLILLRRRLETERTTDWQTLHKRDRGWFLAQPESSPWPLLRDWLGQWGHARHRSAGLLVFALGMAAFVLGFIVMAGLLEFLTFERINLLWFLLIAVLLPVVWWFLALFFSAAQVPFPLRTLYEHWLPQGGVLTALRPLLKVTVMALGQQLSLLFALGMLIAFMLYLLVSDLAFGWSSTLDLSAAWVHQLTSLLAWPWQALWPAGVPSMALIEQTHYYRAAPLVATDPALFGQWWRFLLICLLAYVLVPRLLSCSVYRLRLRRMQGRVRDSDALISGLWQRLTTELIDQEMQQVVQREEVSRATETASAELSYPQIVCWGVWPEALLASLHQQLAADPAAVCWSAIDNSRAIDPVLAILKPLPDQPLLLLCKGWEPPTGELADLCLQLARLRTRLFLWPVPLVGMAAARQQTLIRSWQAFMQQIPDRFHLITAAPSRKGAADV